MSTQTYFDKAIVDEAVYAAVDCRKNWVTSRRLHKLRIEYHGSFHVLWPETKAASLKRLVKAGRLVTRAVKFDEVQYATDKNAAAWTELDRIEKEQRSARVAEEEERSQQRRELRDRLATVSGIPTPPVGGYSISISVEQAEAIIAKLEAL
jgi:hypothetical protein